MVGCKSVVFKKDFAQIFKMRFDVFQFVHNVFWRAHPEYVTIQRLRNHAIAATVWAAAPRKNHDYRVEVRSVKITLVAGKKILVISLAHPRDFVEVGDFRTFGLKVDAAVRRAISKACDVRRLLDFSAEKSYQIPRGVVRFADNHIVESRLHFQAFERFCRRMRSHDGRGDVEHDF